MAQCKVSIHTLSKILLTTVITTSFSSAFASPHSYGANACEKALTSKPKNTSENQKSRAYAKALHELVHATIKLRQLEASGASSPGFLKSVEKELELKKAELKRTLGEDVFAAAFKKALLKATERENLASSRQAQERDKQIKIEEEYIAVIAGMRAVMHRVEPGSFKMGEVNVDPQGAIATDTTVDVTITKPFDMMATPTTQIIWRKIADLAAQKLQGKYEINPDPSHFKGDTRPVEKVSYEDVQIWLNALNELSAGGEPALLDLIPTHREGDVYRLPTEAEWEFVVRGRGEYNGIYHFGNEEAELNKYAWFSENSGQQTQPVANLEPLVIDGRAFYDMHGNVWEWAHDSWDGSAPLKGGTDPVSTSGSYRVVRGASWDRNASFLRSAYRSYVRPGDRYGFVGFRLVRTAK